MHFLSGINPMTNSRNCTLRVPKVGGMLDCVETPPTWIYIKMHCQVRRRSVLDMVQHGTILVLIHAGASSVI